MPLPTTRMQADRIATRLTLTLASTDQSYVVAVAEPTRGDFVITVSIETDTDGGAAGVWFTPSQLDNGASGIDPIALASIIRLTDPTFQDHREIERELAPGFFGDVMTTENTGSSGTEIIVAQSQDDFADEVAAAVVATDPDRVGWLGLDGQVLTQAELDGQPLDATDVVDGVYGFDVHGIDRPSSHLTDINATNPDYRFGDPVATLLADLDTQIVVDDADHGDLLDKVFVETQGLGLELHGLEASDLDLGSVFGSDAEVVIEVPTAKKKGSKKDVTVAPAFSEPVYVAPQLVVDERSDLFPGFEDDLPDMVYAGDPPLISPIFEMEPSEPEPTKSNAPA